MTWITITPTDVLLFRDGKPFSAGADHSANSLFPPTPMTVQGALRAKISMDQGVAFHEYRDQSTEGAKIAADYIGLFGKDRLDTGRFFMRGPFIGLVTPRGVVPLYRMPADLLIRDDDDKCDEDRTEGPSGIITGPNLKVQYHDPFDDNRITPEVDTFPMVHLHYENKANQWITADGMVRYLAGQFPEVETDKKETTTDDCHSEKNPLKAYQEGKRIFKDAWLFTREYRFGVSTDALKSFREDGQLYQVGFIRMREGVTLLVDVNGIPDGDLLKTPDMTIGGEQGRAMAQKATLAAALPDRPQTISGRFKIVVLTPAYLSGGWRSQNWAQLFNGVDPGFVTAALDRPQYIGGWSTAAGSARAMHAYVAPGSVYYFDAKERTITLPAAFTDTPDGIADAGKLGFGQYLVTEW